MWNRASRINLVVSLLSFWAFMVILLSAVGFGIGTAELIIWLAALAVGVFLILRRHLRARRLRAGLSGPVAVRG